MKQKVSLFLIYLLLFVMLVCSSCGISNGEPLTPFTELDFNNTVGDMLEVYGETQEIKVNEDGYTEYFYPYEYEGRTGELRFSVNSQNKIEQISWLYEPLTADEVTTCAEEWENLFIETYGEPDFTNSAGKIWYTKLATIGVAKASFFSTNVVWIIYTNPEIKNAETMSQFAE